MQRDEKMYLWFEEMGLINEPKQDKDDLFEELKESMKIVAKKNKLTRKRDKNMFMLRGKAV